MNDEANSAESTYVPPEVKPYKDPLIKIVRDRMGKDAEELTDSQIAYALAGAAVEAGFMPYGTAGYNRKGRRELLKLHGRAYHGTKA